MIQLDTSFLIRALVRGSPEDALLRGWLRDRTPLGASAIAWTEFLCGPLRAPDIELAAQVVGEILPFAAEDAVVAVDLFNRSGRRRGSLVDCMVASVALGRESPLATANPADFRRLEASGVKLMATKRGERM